MMTETTIDAPAPETSPAETATPAAMHRYSGYVHLGAGAEDCEHATDGACQERDHFHAWCRLPNQFERSSLTEKANAAMARRLRLLRDPQSDPRVILDGELEGIKARNDRDTLVEEIVGAEFLTDHLQALKEVGEGEDGDDDKWETIDEDRERLRALEEMSAEERPEEEYIHLKDHLEEHTKLVNDRRDEIQEPRRQSVADKTIDELIDIVREQRIDASGQGERRQEYAKWEWYIGTFKPKSPDKPGFPSERVFASIDDFTHAPPEQIDAISELISRLDREASEALKG